ncbi:MAG TPA: exodeoxyribonuclease VII small subunit [Campylobacterales bacterium]|nr:exodeoxyribonuclease VII small subunit [Campylobacterales bacterium]
MKNKDFEEKIEHAKKMIDSLMDPNITLANSVKMYKEGIKALKEAQELLEKAKLEIEEIEKEQKLE